MIAAALALTMTVCGSSTAIAASELTAESKPATQYTIDATRSNGNGDVAENWKTMLTEIQLKLIKEGQKFSKKLGQWDYFGEPIGDFNTEYAYRALVALAGLGANTVEVALYPKIEQDADGNTLLNFL